MQINIYFNFNYKQNTKKQNNESNYMYSYV